MSQNPKIDVEPEGWVRASIDGEPAGRVRMRNSPLDWGLGTIVPAVGIAGVRTEEKYRKHGIASHIMSRAIEETLKRSCPVGCVSTDRTNIAGRLYSKMGYVYLFSVTIMGRNVGRPDPVPPPPGVTLRPFSPGDEQHITALWDLRHTQAGFFGEIRTPPNNWLLQREDQLEKDPESVWVAERQGQLIGWAEYYMQWKTTEHCMFHVEDHPDARAVALALMTKVEGTLSERGLRKLCLDASPHQPAIHQTMLDLGCRPVESFVFHLAVLDLAGLLKHLKPLFEKRIEGNAPESWPGVLRVETGEQTGEIKLAGGEPDRTLVLSGDRTAITRVLCGRIGAWDAYRRNQLNIGGNFDEHKKYSLNTFLTTYPWFHPMRCRD